MSNKLEQYSYSIKKERQRKTLNFVIFFVLFFVIVNLVIAFLAFPVKQVTNSMTPDLPENSLVMVTPLLNNVERGDIILMNAGNSEEKVSFFKKCVSVVVRFFTAQQITPYEKNDLPGSKQKIRRVVAVPGDTIYMRDYVLYIKPAGSKHFLTEFETAEKTYNVTFYVAPGGWDSSIGVKGSFDEMQLGPDQYFVLGDNRKSCDDSRLWGPVQINDFYGKCLLCYFPFKNIKLF